MSKKNNQLPKADKPNIAKQEPKIIANTAAKPLNDLTSKPTNENITKWISALMVLLISFFTFYNSHNNNFVLDDHGIIKSNKITKAGISAENLKTIFTTSHRKGDVSDLEHSLYRPVAKAIFAYEWQLSNDMPDSDRPHLFHWGNILFYMLTCIVLFLVLYHAFNKNWILALCTSVLYAVHPIHSEVVSNIKSLDEINGMLGSLLALRCFQLYVSKNNNIVYLVLAFLSYCFGIFSKESAVTLIAIAPVFLYYFHNATLKQMLISAGVLIAGFVLFYIARDHAIGWFFKLPAKDPSALDNVLALTKADAAKVGGYQMSKFIPTIIYLAGYYIYKLFYPATLSCDYSYATVNIVDFSTGQLVPQFFMALLFFAAIVIFAVITFKKKNIVGFGILWWLLSYSIVSNLFIVIGVSVGDRLMFMPSLGWCIAIAGTMYYMFKYFNIDVTKMNFITGIKKHATMIGITALISIPFVIKAMDRNAAWAKDYELFKRDIENFPNSTHLMFYWGNHLTSNEYAEGKPAAEVTRANGEAIETFKRSMSFYPALPSDGYNQYGKAYYNLYLANPVQLASYMDSASIFYQRAHSEDTTNSVFMNNIGTVYFTRANQLKRMDYFDSAYKYFYGAYLRDTTVIDYMNNIGALRGTLGFRQEAIQWLYKGFKSDSVSQGAILSAKMIGGTYRDMGDSVNARAWFGQATQIEKTRLARLTVEQ